MPGLARMFSLNSLLHTNSQLYAADTAIGSNPLQQHAGCGPELKRGSQVLAKVVSFYSYWQAQEMVKASYTERGAELLTGRKSSLCC